MESSVLTEKRGKVLIIKLNVPKKLNPLGPILRENLKLVLRNFESDQESQVAILTGEGKAFSAGGDLEALKVGMKSVKDAADDVKGSNVIPFLIANIEKPIIAAVNGPAYGAGFSVAIACDLVIASTEASFMQAFTKVGLMPDMGSLYFLPRLVGTQKAKELIWTAKMIKADEAMAMGIVNEVVKHENLESHVIALANKIADGPTPAIGFVKTILARSLEGNLDDILAYERLGQALCLLSEDHKEGVAAFFGKRKPIFSSK